MFLLVKNEKFTAMTSGMFWGCNQYTSLVAPILPTDVEQRIRDLAE